MSYGEFKEKRKIRQTEQIIEMLFGDSTISNDDKKTVMQWLISENNQDLKTEALKRKFQEEFRYESDPVYALEMWPELSRRLNLTTDVMQVLRRMKRAGHTNGRPGTVRPLHARPIFRIAAVLLPAIAIGTALYFAAGDRTEQPVELLAELVEVHASDNELKTVILPDSSKVWLKSGSTIEYYRDFSENRLIKLKGEAYFSVKASNGAVFTVEADDIMATVLGTKFNVRAYRDESESQITLDEGSIEVYAANEKILMKPHDRITLNKKTNRLKIEENIDAHENNRVGQEFYDNTLREILMAIAIDFDMELEIRGGLPDYGIRFGFDQGESLDTILSVLKNAYKSFDYEIAGDRISITVN